jgi:uncharacterized protein (DUF2267 family)
MNFDEFVGEVQHRARLASEGEAVRAISATFHVLGQRLYGGEVEDLAAQLPREISAYLHTAQEQTTYSLDEFFEKVAEHEEIDLPESVHHTRAVIDVMSDVVSAGEMRDVRAQLPEEYDALFEAGSSGELDT